ncbi:MAG: cyclic-di-AMP receptor [Anaerolineales bacterium]|jgi:uncharacterized protein YaaQ|nr:cyclic-di-AMP receptor [Anaerolineales bacterium]
MTINRLMTAVIQIQDVDATIEALHKAGFLVTHIGSSGGFLGNRNSTLLIGLTAGQEEKAVKIMNETCRRRVEYVATPLEGAPFHLPLTTPVTVGGATIFTLEVEHYEVVE